MKGLDLIGHALYNDFGKQFIQFYLKLIDRVDTSVEPNKLLLTMDKQMVNQLLEFFTFWVLSRPYFLKDNTEYSKEERKHLDEDILKICGVNLYNLHRFEIPYIDPLSILRWMALNTHPKVTILKNLILPVRDQKYLTLTGYLGTTLSSYVINPKLPFKDLTDPMISTNAVSFLFNSHCLNTNRFGHMRDIHDDRLNLKMWLWNNCNLTNWEQLSNDAWSAAMLNRTKTLSLACMLIYMCRDSSFSSNISGYLNSIVKSHNDFFSYV